MLWMDEADTARGNRPPPADRARARSGVVEPHHVVAAGPGARRVRAPPPLAVRAEPAGSGARGGAVRGGLLGAAPLRPHPVGAEPDHRRGRPGVSDADLGRHPEADRRPVREEQVRRGVRTARHVTHSRPVRPRAGHAAPGAAHGPIRELLAVLRLAMGAIAAAKRAHRGEHALPLPRPARSLDPLPQRPEDVRVRGNAPVHGHAAPRLLPELQVRLLALRGGGAEHPPARGSGAGLLLHHRLPDVGPVRRVGTRGVVGAVDAARTARSNPELPHRGAGRASVGVRAAAPQGRAAARRRAHPPLLQLLPRRPDGGQRRPGLGVQHPPVGRAVRGTVHERRQRHVPRCGICRRWRGSAAT